MDPRHPEQAISRMRELMKQYDRIEKDMGKATTSAQLAQLEREGGLVIQEICLVAPRMHEAMMQTSRQRRVDLARQILIPSTDEESKKSLEFFKEAGKEDVKEITVTPVEAVAIVEDLGLVSTEVKDSDDKTSFEVEQVYKPKKKTTKKKATKKKTTKKKANK